MRLGQINAGRTRGALRRALLAVFVGSAALVAAPQAASGTESNPGDCAPMTDSIARLYSAYFLRAPDANGYGFWVDEFSNGRRGLQNMSDFFSDSDEFKALYANLSNREFVQLVYQNVLGRQPDTDGLNFWTGRLDDGSMSRGTVMINFSESSEYVIKTATSKPLAGYFNWYPEGARFSCGYGNYEHPTLQQTQLDVLAIHDSFINEQGTWIDIYSNGAGQSDLVGSEFVPYDHLYREQFPAQNTPPPDEVISTRAEDQIFSVVVSYDGPTMIDFADRGGQKTGELARPTTEEFYADLAAAETVVNAFWAANWSNHFTGVYRPPTVVGLYDGTRPGAPTCGPFTLDPYNAFYCTPGDYVAWDVNLLSIFYSHGGDAMTYLLVAHEWGHAMQARLVPEDVSIASELQADCLAGAALYGAQTNAFTTNPGSNALIFEPGDVEELGAALVAIADEVPWADPSSHGDASQRTDAFSAGALGGIDACFS